MLLAGRALSSAVPSTDAKMVHTYRFCMFQFRNRSLNSIFANTHSFSDQNSEVSDVSYVRQYSSFCFLFSVHQCKQKKITGNELLQMFSLSCLLRLCRLCGTRMLMDPRGIYERRTPHNIFTVHLFGIFGLCSECCSQFFIRLSQIILFRIHIFFYNMCSVK